MTEATTPHPSQGLMIKGAILAVTAVLVISSSGFAAEESGPTESVVIEPQPVRISERIAEALDDDPEAIFRLVSDHVRYEPYAGVLRGAAGTWYGRAGNSPDQALLLARLLDASGVETRFAVGAIEESTADALLAAGAVGPDVIRDQLARGLYGRLPDDETLPALPSRAEYVPAFASEQDDLVESWAAEQLNDTLDLLGSALAASGHDVEGSFTSVPADELTQHTWVQASLDGEWVDLDPSLPGNAVGDTLTAAEATVEELPEERWHRVEVAVLAERAVDGSLVSEELMRLDGTAEEFAGQPIIITNVGKDSVPTLARAFEAVLGVQTVHPAIVVGNENMAGGGMLFKDDGEGGGGLGGGFFDAGDAAEEATAQWIELTVTSPDREPVVTRRTVFDRVGPDTRATGSVDIGSLEPVATYDFDGDGQTAFEPEHWITWLSVATGVPSMRAHVADLADDDPRRVGIVPFSYHLLDQLGSSLDGPALGVRPFIDAPNVTAFTGQVVDGPGGEPALEAVLDIWHRSSGAAEVDGIDAVADPAMLPGIVAHVSERLMTGSADAVGGQTPSVGAIFEAASAQGIGPTVLSAPDQVAALGTSPESRLLLATALEDGWLAVAPGTPVELGQAPRQGWWLVDPDSGRVIDQMDDGRGAVTAGKVIFGGLVGLLAAITIDHVISLFYNEVEGRLWDKVIKDIKEKVGF